MLRPALAVLVLAASAGMAHANQLPGAMGMYTTTGGTPLAMLDSVVDATVRGPIVEVVVSQQYRNPTDRVTEATYIFPLPADAAVSAMQMKIGTRTIHAAIEKRAEAQRRYEDAVAAGLGAGLLEQERPDVFTQTISAIPAHAIVEVTLRFDAVASFQGGGWELVLPMVVAPRYVAGTASGRPTTGSGRAPDTDRALDASRVTPGGKPGAGGKTAVALHFVDAVEAVASSTHDLVGSGKSYTFADAHSDHDAIVRWRSGTPAGGWVEQDADGGYAAVLVEAAPPAPRKGALKLVVVLDRAATTRGDADLVEHPFVNALLARFDMGDRIAVTGSDQVAWSAPGDARHALDVSWPHPAGAFDLTRQLRDLRPDGGTILLISDGLVADDKPAIAAALHAGVPIHVLGIGPAPNRSLLIAIANQTGGTIRFASTGDDLGALAGDVLADLASPPVPLAVNWGTLAASDVVPALLPRIGAGQALLVMARVKHVQAANGRARGDVFAIEALPAAPAVGGAVTTRGALARRWARARLDELLAGKPDAAIVTAHALHYGLVSPYTSMVAIGDEVLVEGGVKHTVAVPVSVPAGMRWQDVKHETTVETKNLRERDQKKQPGHATTPPPAPPTAPAGTTVTQQPTPTTPAPVATGRFHAGEDDDDGDANADRPRKKVAKEKDKADEAPRSAPEPDVATRSLEQEAEPMALRASSIPQRRLLRLSLSLGGGLAFDHGTDSLVSLAGRVEYGRLTMVGLDAALWIVGERAQGYALATVARRGFGHFELGAGFGLHLGTDLGPAASLSLRYAPRLVGPAGFLRYDGAFLGKVGGYEAEHALTLGAELRW